MSEEGFQYPAAKIKGKLELPNILGTESGPLQGPHIFLNIELSLHHKQLGPQKYFESICVCMSWCVVSEFMGKAHRCTCGGQRRTSGVLPYHSSPYFLETGFLTELDW